MTTDDYLQKRSLEIKDVESEVEKATAVCGICKAVHDEGDLFFFDETLLCEYCYDEQTSICDECGERFWNNEGYRSDSHCLCESCYNNNYVMCSDCGTILHNNYAYYFDDDCDDTPYCENCYDKHNDQNIHNYYYKPEPIFYGFGLFMGVELEVDNGGENRENAGEILNIANFEAEHLYIKKDGSLDNGFEMVTHPMSLSYHMNNIPWKKILTKALHMGYKSHDSGTCGLHIHIGRKELGDNQEIQEEVIGRILYFIEKHWEQMLKFSRRTESQINQWAARYGCKENPKETLKHAKGTYARYVSLNLQNHSTIEFRMFRGSLKYNTFAAALQLVYTICDAAIFMSDEDFEVMTWSSFISTIDTSEMPELVGYLNERGLYEALNNLSTEGSN